MPDLLWPGSEASSPRERECEVDQERHNRIFELFHASDRSARPGTQGVRDRGERRRRLSRFRSVAPALPRPGFAPPRLSKRRARSYRHRTSTSIVCSSSSVPAAWARSTWPNRKNRSVGKVALKIIKMGMDTKEVIARFRSERQALAMMDHLNIAKIHDAGATRGRSSLLRDGARATAFPSPSTATGTA